MKKALLLIMGTLLSLVLVACSNDSSAPQEEGKKVEEKQDIKEQVHAYSIGKFE